MSHSLEPWVLKSTLTDVWGADGSHVVDTKLMHIKESYEIDVLNARRIVACVNACAGIDTEYLEAMRNTTILKNSEGKYKELLQQRDELLAALKGLIEFAEPYFDKDGFGYVGKLETAKKCIAKAEGRF
jgi:hypothetical protein